MQALAPYQRRVIYVFVLIILSGLLLKVIDRQKQAIAFDLSGFMDGYHHSRAISKDSIIVNVSSNAASLSDSADLISPANMIIIRKININTADIYSLQALPGIGPSLADKIIEYRREISQFSEFDDLLKVKGIGRQKLQELKKYISFEKADN